MLVVCLSLVWGWVDGHVLRWSNPSASAVPQSGLLSLFWDLASYSYWNQVGSPPNAPPN